jgi:hypothetical protein
VGPDVEMVKMSEDRPVFIPPVVLERYEELERYEDFKEYARNAALVTYDPDYFVSPFLDDRKRLRRVTLYAIGVRVKGVPLTFKYAIDIDSLQDKDKSWNEQADEIDKLISGIVASLGQEVELIRGKIESEASLGEALAMRS